VGSRAFTLWVAIGGGAGIGAGLFDGLLAAAEAPAGFDAWRALALAIGSLAAVGSALAPAAAGVAGARDPHARSKPARVLLLLLAAALGALASGSTSLYAMARLRPEFGGVALPVAAWVVAVSVLVAAARAARPIARRRRGAAALVALAAACAIASGVAARLRDREPSGGASASAARAATPAASVPNVLLVVLDTVRADRLSLYGHAAPTSPALAAFARDALVFERAISAAPWTVPSHATLFTGLAPATHGATGEQRVLRADLDTLAERLRERGFETAAISCNPNVSRALGFAQGFDEFHEPFREASGERALDRTLVGRALRMARADKGAARAVALASAWLDARRARDARPFFLFVNLLEAHLPYDPPRAERERFLAAPLRPRVRELTGRTWSGAAYRRIGLRDLAAEDLAQLAALYDAEIAYQDAQLGALLASLRRTGQLDATLVVVVSDHGENLGEHGLVDHVFSIHQTLLHVPLLVRLPGRFAGGVRYPQPVATGSLFATILAETGAPPPSGTAAYPALPRTPRERAPSFVASEYELPVPDLASLAREVPGIDLRRFAVRSRAVLRDRWKLVSRLPGEVALFDLASDPLEERPLDPRARAEGRSLEQALAAWHASLPVRAARDEAIPGPDAVTRASLRALGYAE
jgi:arylsulfatase A-like enzyme